MAAVNMLRKLGEVEVRACHLWHVSIQTDKPYGHDASRSQGCHLDIRAQIEKSQCESMRMSMDSIVPKY